MPDTSDNDPMAATDEPSPAEPTPDATPEPEAEFSAPPVTDPPVAAATPDLGNRAVALLIDALCAFVIGWVPGVGGLVGAAYMLLRDGLELDFMSHRSLGKSIMRLHVEALDGTPVDVVTSMRRNWMFALGPLAQTALFIPFVGWFLLFPLLAAAALLAGLVETVMVLSDADGRRIGDKIAATVVRAD